MALPPDPSPPELHYVAEQDFIDKIGLQKAIAIFDDDNDGAADPRALRRHLYDSEAYVESFARAAGYPIDKVRAQRPQTIVRLVLEHAFASAIVRHPEIMVYDGEKALERVRVECLMIQKKQMRLDVDLDDPKSTTIGGSVGRIGVSDPCPPSSFFANLGDFPGGSRFG